jgi:hypothetical protein
VEALSENGAMPATLVAALDRHRVEVSMGEGRKARLFRPIRGGRRLGLTPRISGDEAPRLALSTNGLTTYGRRMNQTSLEDLVVCYPMRTFSRRHGQSNKPVAFFSRTVGDLVVCESQHERRFLILADWHPGVAFIAAQPFTIEFGPSYELESHTPDFVLITRTGASVVVDVKWPTALEDEEEVRRLDLVSETLRASGMHHATWIDAPTVLTENLALFAAARVPEPLMAQAAPAFLGGLRPAMTVAELGAEVARSHRIPESTGLVVIRQLLWEHQLSADLSAPFGADTILSRS